MPKSKRSKVVHLSKTTRKGKQLTIRLYATIRESIPKYPYIYVFSVDNMRNTYLKDVRTQLSDSRLFFGKTKVMAKALGDSPATEPFPGTSLLSPHLTGAVGLLFTPRDPQAVASYFESFCPLDYARAGTVASRSFTIPAGTLYSRAGEIPESEDVPIGHSAEPGLRKLGVPTRLVKGRIELEHDFEVCKDGQVLGSGQTTLLKMFGIATAEFRVGVRAYWRSDIGEVMTIEESSEDVGVTNDEISE